MQSRRAFVAGLAAPWLLSPVGAYAQSPSGRAPRIGILIAESVADQSARLDALRAGLQDLGYIVGKDLAFDIRAADGRYERLSGLAMELARLRVDLLVAFGIKALVAAKQATTTIPIVIPATSSDLVAMKLITSLARPGGNITGSTTFGSEVMAERLEIVRDVLPRATGVAVLTNPANASFGPTFRQMDATARSLKIALKVFEAATATQFERLFENMVREQVDALVVQDDTMFATHAAVLAELATRHRLAAIGSHGLAEAGGLVGYGRDEVALYRRSAHYVDRILKGAAPGLLPIEQANRFELWVNLTTAQSLGIRMPEALLIRADKTLR